MRGQEVALGKNLGEPGASVSILPMYQESDQLCTSHMPARLRKRKMISQNLGVPRCFCIKASSVSVK